MIAGIYSALAMCQYLYICHLIIPAAFKIETIILQMRKPRLFKYCPQGKEVGRKKPNSLVSKNLGFFV